MASIDENIDKFEQIEKSIEQLEGIDFLYFFSFRELSSKRRNISNNSNREGSTFIL